ncbi:MAG: TraR/DksA C4-type zinc finger protein [Candidatus Jorgensenbacteria bacterium]|nr:TraR/DksA C4-type zinc finger protein [Candidatus Jorgensenbacteria bacterium]
MKREDRKKLEEELRKKEEKLEVQLADFKKDLNFGDDIDHLEEEADEAEEFGTWLGLKRIVNRQLSRVRLALAKMNIGTYGICESCGKEIERELLAVDPESTYCKNCKQER